MAWITDSLTNAIAFASRLNPFAGRQGVLPSVFSHQLALAAYMESGLLRKIIQIPAADRTQKWRDWQADKKTIAAVEKEEKRLGLRAKVKQAEVLRGVGGGALIIVTAGNHDQPLTPEMVSEGGIVAINVASRWEISARDFDTNLASPTYRQPGMFQINGATGSNDRIHPSRVICFRGEPVPAGGAISDEDAFWGDCRLLRVFKEVQNSDQAQQWFVQLVRKAKLLRIGIPDLLDLVATEDGKQRLNERVALIATGESSLNATVYRSGTGADDPGEKIDDYQINWSGIPAYLDTLDKRAAAVADIPVTRLFGTSPGGMNATGEHDLANWWDAVGDGQENETRPCLEMLDPLLLRSAGVAKPDDVWWVWAPLRKPTEKEEAETFDLLMDAIGKLIDSGLVPQEALARAVQNLIEERGYMPGLADALAKLPEDIRFGFDPEDDGSDPSALANEQQGGGDPESQATAGGDGSAPARRAANDAKPVPLYVQRKLLNGSELARWAKDQGFQTTLDPSDMHVTVLYSRNPVDPIKMGNGWTGDEKGNLTVKPGGPRAVEKLGMDAVVLLFASDDLSWRHRQMVEAGASHDYDEYQPHVTLTYDAGDVDLEAIKPFTGELRFGPELFEPLDLDWKSKITEE